MKLETILQGLKTADPATITRSIILIVALANQILVSAGYDRLPWADTTIGDTATYIITAVVSLWTWWKNNSITKNAQISDTVLSALKSGETTAGVIDSVIGK